MNVGCPSCSTVYRVDPAKVPAEGVRARCAVCAAVFPVTREAPVVEAPPAPPVVAAPAPSAAPVEVPRVAPRPVSAPASPPQRWVMPPVVGPAPPRGPHVVPPAMPGARPPVMPRPAGPAVATPPAARAPVASVPGSPPPLNPFLANDPSQKARRLARALVSDMVVYHPAKRREALQAGTLREAFEEEIAKSWEEYVEQVGRELADASTHFKDALNEILADGRAIF